MLLDEVKAAHEAEDHDALASLDSTQYAEVAAELRGQSDALNLQIHDDALDLRPSEVGELKAQKRDLDARAFELEQAVRAIGAAVDALNPDAVHGGVDLDQEAGGIVDDGTPFTWQ